MRCQETQRKIEQSPTYQVSRLLHQEVSFCKYYNADGDFFQEHFFEREDKSCKI